MSKIDIPGWLPSRWSECIGNRQLKSALRALLRQVRVDGVHRATNILVVSPSRTGKTATIKLFAKALLCEHLDPTTLDPCGKCRTCSEKAETHGDHGLFADLAGTDRQYIPIDCTKVLSPQELIKDLRELRECKGTRVLFLDELHRLQHRDLDEQLLKPTEEKGFIWIAATAEIGKLEGMFVKRWTRLATELPFEEEMALWLADRCNEFRVRYEPEAILRLVRRSDRVPGVALRVLDLASLSEDGLTVRLVEEYDFSVAD